MNGEGKCITISTKLRADVWYNFQCLCKKKHTTPYDFLKNVIVCLTKSADEKHVMDPHTEKLVKVFDGVVEEQFSFADIDMKDQVVEATYYIDDESGEKNGTYAVLVNKPFFGKSMMTFNIFTIAERMFCLLFHKMYMKLRNIAIDEECHNVIEVIDVLIRHYDETHDRDHEYINGLFSDTERGDFGQERHHGGPFVRHNNISDQQYYLRFGNNGSKEEENS